MEVKLTPDERAQKLPEIIQGGMGVAVSNWQLAGEVASTGEMGVVSGTAIGIVLARRLQNGDFDGKIRQALGEFPDQEMVEKIINDYYLPDGRHPDQPYKNVPLHDENSMQKAQELTIVGSFVEVFLAKQLASEKCANPGPIAINILTKLQIPTISTIYGAIIAGADGILAGAGIPKEMPKIASTLANGELTSNQLNVIGSIIRNEILFDPADYPLLLDVPKTTPATIGIISTDVLASALARDDGMPTPNGYIIESSDAGGHNAPPRGKKNFDEIGQPIYSDRDIANLAKVASLGKPFWLAGGYGTPEGLLKAKKLGANGIQVGSAFALSEKSGLTPSLRDSIIKKIISGELNIYTSAEASPTGFPFKLLIEKNTKPQIHNNRICDVGGLREAYSVNGTDIFGYLCPAENVNSYKNKGGDEIKALGKLCLCNGLFATVGLGQVRGNKTEEAIITLGDKAPETVKRLVGKYGLHYSAVQVVEFLRG